MYGVNFSGGDNRTHGLIERAERIDAFEIGHKWHGDLLAGHTILDFEKQYDGEREAVELSHPGSRWREVLYIVHIENVSRQTFFLCPCCGRRRRYLYFSGRRFKCRTCARLNYRSQQRTRDVCNFAYDGLEYARRKLGFYPDHAICPAEFPGVTPDKPRGMHWATYSKRMKRLRWYQQRYSDESMAQMLSIIGRMEARK